MLGNVLAGGPTIEKSTTLSCLQRD